MKQPIIIRDSEDGIELICFPSEKIRDNFWDELELDNDIFCKGTKKGQRFTIECDREGTQVCFCEQIKNKQVFSVINYNNKN